MRAHFYFTTTLLLIALSGPVSAQQPPVGLWKFDDPGDLTRAESSAADHYWVTSEGGVSEDRTFTSVPDGDADFSVRKAPYLIYAGTNAEMEVHWQLYGTAGCTIEWGADTSYSLGSGATSEYGADHQHTYTIDGLIPGTLYFYRMTAAETYEYTGSFRAAPAGSETQVSFLAYGDTRTYPADHDAVAAAMISNYTSDPDCQSFTLVVGDLVSSGNDEADWDTEFFGSTYTNIQALLANAPYLSAMGNHEGNGVLFQKYFPYPFVAGRYWSYDYGPAHFTVVDQYTSYSPGSPQLQWIEDDLAASNKPWKFIYLHEPGWSAGGHSNEIPVQDYIQPLCEEYGVSIVFAGHNHYYARALVNGVHHVTTGGGGAPLYTPDPGYPYVVQTAKEYHYCKVSIDGSALNFEAVKPDGTVLDAFISTGPPPVSNLRAQVVDSCLALIWSSVTEANHYVIYRDSLASFEPAPEDSVGATVDTSYVDCDPAAVEAYYVVRAVDAFGRKSEDSQKVGQFQRELDRGE